MLKKGTMSKYIREWFTGNNVSFPYPTSTEDEEESSRNIMTVLEYFEKLYHLFAMLGILLMVSHIINR